MTYTNGRRRKTVKVRRKGLKHNEPERKAQIKREKQKSEIFLASFRWESSSRDSVFFPPVRNPYLYAVL